MSVQEKSVVLPGEQDDLCLCRLRLVLAGEGAGGAVPHGVCLSACWCWLTGPADRGMSGSVSAIPGGKRH